MSIIVRFDDLCIDNINIEEYVKGVVTNLLASSSLDKFIVMTGGDELPNLFKVARHDVTALITQHIRYRNLTPLFVNGTCIVRGYLTIRRMNEWCSQYRSLTTKELMGLQDHILSVTV